MPTLHNINGDASQYFPADGCARLRVQGGPVVFHQGDRAAVLSAESEPIDVEPSGTFLIYGLEGATLELYGEEEVRR